MTGLHRVFDASIPPALVPQGYAGCAGYIGRPGRTPHVWLPEEWNRLYHLVQFPIWVPDLTVAPASEAMLMLSALNSFGWHGGRLAVVVDYETAGRAEAGWHQQLAGYLDAKEFETVAYGSISTVLEIAADHVWAADWDGDAAAEPGMTVHGHQYLSGSEFDLNVVDDWLMARGLHRA